MHFEITIKASVERVYRAPGATSGIMSILLFNPTQEKKRDVYLMHSHREELWNKNCRICSGAIITGALRISLAFNGCLIAEKRANRKNRTKLRRNEKQHYLPLSMV